MTIATILAALENACSFIEGFEGDELQDGLPEELLVEIDAAKAAALALSGECGPTPTATIKPRLACPNCGDETHIYRARDFRWNAEAGIWDDLGFRDDLDCTECDHNWPAATPIVGNCSTVALPDESREGKAMEGNKSALNNRTLASIVAEFFGDDETKSVVYCDAGNGCGFGEDGRVTDYDPAKMASLIMTDIPDGEDRVSGDGFESTTQCAWQDGENGYRWRVRF